MEPYIVTSVSISINDIIINVLVICNINYVLIIPLTLVTLKDAVMIFTQIFYSLFSDMIELTPFSMLSDEFSDLDHGFKMLSNVN